MVKFTQITINDIENEAGSDVYVLNRGIIKYGRKTNIIFSHSQPGTQGNSQAYVIPPTFIPYNVGEAIPKDDLLRNAAFRSLISVGTLQLVKSSEAKEFFKNDSGAREELQRIKNERLSAFSPSDANLSDMSATPSQNDAENAPEGTNVNPVVFDIMNRDEFTPQTIINQLRTLEGTLTDHDWNYVVSKTTNEDILKLANSR